MSRPTFQLYNTMTRAVEPLKPLDPAGKRVSLYVCGPTIYNYGAHRQFPHLRRGRSAAPRAEAFRLPGRSRHAVHRRRRQDHPRLAREEPAAEGIHRDLSPGLSRGREDAEHRDPRAHAQRDRPHPGDDRADPKARSTRSRPTSPTTARSISASPRFRSTAASAISTSPA